MGAFWGLLGASYSRGLEVLFRVPPLGPLLGRSWGRLGHVGPIVRRLGALLEVSWAVLGASWAVLGASGAVLKPSWAVLGPSWGPLMPPRGDLGGLLGRRGASGSRNGGNARILQKPKENRCFSPLGAFLGRLSELCWGLLGSSLAICWLSWAHFGPAWGHLGRLGRLFEAP